MQSNISLIGRYEILSEIGEGRLSVVYEANDPKTNRKVAIKLLKDKTSLDEFLRESRLIGKLSHHNIVTIYDFGEHQGHPYVAMELLQGQPLDLLLRHSQRLRWSQVVELAKQLASALDYAHNLGIMHGDIKPANILYDSENHKAILTDFGNAKQTDIYETHTLKVHEVDASTPYLSPEHVRGQQVDQRSDLFSLGVVLYQLLTGEKPFDAADFQELTTQITQRAHKAISVSVNQVPEQLIHIVDRLLYKNPEDRIQSAAELLQELERLPQHFDIPSAHGGRRVVAFSAAILVLASFAAAVYVITSPPPEPAPSSIAEQPTTPTPAPQTRITPLETARKQTSLEAQINKSLSKFECSSLFAELTPDKQVKIRGHVSAEEDLMAVMDLMDGFPQLNSVTYEVNALKWPFCEAVSILSVDKHKNVSRNSGLKLIGQSLGHAKAEDKKVKFEVDYPNFDAYLYMDYYQGDGTVHHILSNKAAKYHGEDKHKSKYIFDTHLNLKGDGQGLVVVIASYNPIAGKRPEREPAQQYLTELHKQVVVNKAELAADYLLLENIDEPKI